MTTLQERKMQLEKELAELEVLENAAKIREEIADKEKRIESLILSLKNEPLFCKMPISSIAHIKTIFQSPLCSSACFFHDTCTEIFSLTGKKIVSRSNGKKEIPEDEIKFKNVKIDKDFSTKGLFKFTVRNIPGMTDKSFSIPYPVNGTFADFKKSLKEMCPQGKNDVKIMRSGQYQGLTHEKSMSKLFAK